MGSNHVLFPSRRPLGHGSRLLPNRFRQSVRLRQRKANSSSTSLQKHLPPWLAHQHPFILARLRNHHSGPWCLSISLLTPNFFFFRKCNWNYCLFLSHHQHSSQLHLRQLHRLPVFGPQSRFRQLPLRCYCLWICFSHQPRSRYLPQLCPDLRYLRLHPELQCPTPDLQHCLGWVRIFLILWIKFFSGPVLDFRIFVLLWITLL